MRDAETLPCGCVLARSDDRVLTITACRAGCPNLANALRLADDAELPVTVREWPPRTEVKGR
jgi:hypothetical protein